MSSLQSESVSRRVGDGRGPTARERSRRRKMFYLVAIISLVVVLFALGFPSTVGTENAKGQPGGLLAQYRDKHELGQAGLGEIDPMSETVHLASLGMRGVGSSLLWLTAQEQQMKKDWTQLRATLDQITKFQPHSIQVWKYQAWNLSYNVSVAFDDYHDKFYWVIEGLNYLLQGVKLNDKEPRLYWDMGWFISNKIGKADESKYYRRLFAGKKDVSASVADYRNDSARDDAGRDYSPEYVKEFREHYTPPTGFPRGCDVRDNWHVGKAWFLAAESKIDPPKYPVKSMAEVIFYSDAPTCQFYYADNLEKDGRFDQVAVNAWKQATREWNRFANNFDMQSSFSDLPQAELLPRCTLDDKEKLDKQIAENAAALDKLAPGKRREIEKELRSKLTPEEGAAWEAAKHTPPEKLTPRQNVLIMQIGDRMTVHDDMVANRAPPERRAEAKKLVKQIDLDRTAALRIEQERSKVNFDFWRTRAEAEASDDCVAARRAIHDGDEAFAKGDQIRARKYYEEGIPLWDKVLKRYPLLIPDPSLGGDLMDMIKRYEKCLAQDDLDLPQPFILQYIVDQHGKGG